MTTVTSGVIAALEADIREVEEAIEARFKPMLLRTLEKAIEETVSEFLATLSRDVGGEPNE